VEDEERRRFTIHHKNKEEAIQNWAKQGRTHRGGRSKRKVHQ
jgi:hypothetical protein